MKLMRLKADCTFVVGGKGNIDAAAMLLAAHFDKLASGEESPLELESGEIELTAVTDVVTVSDVARAVDEVGAKRKVSATIEDSGRAKDR